MSINPINIVSTAKNVVSRLPEAFAPNLESIPMQTLPLVDMTKEVIVIWVPGTNNHRVHPHFAAQAKLRWGNRASVVLSDYEAKWTFTTSIPDGYRMLKHIVDYVLKHRRPGQRIVLAGESQGALIIGELMARKEYYKAIDKAVLLGHPGISERHYDSDKKVLEINNPSDPATFKWPGEAVEIFKNLDKFFRKDLTTVPFFLKTAVNAPIQAARLLFTSFGSIPFLSDILPHPHTYSGRMEEAVLWLNA